MYAFTVNSFLVNSYALHSPILDRIRFRSLTIIETSC